MRLFAAAREKDLRCRAWPAKTFLSVPSVCQLVSLGQSSHILKFKFVVIRKDVEAISPESLAHGENAQLNLWSLRFVF